MTSTTSIITLISLMLSASSCGPSDLPECEEYLLHRPWRPEDDED